MVLLVAAVIVIGVLAVRLVPARGRRVEGEVTFATDAEPDRLVYRSSPVVVWRRS